MTLSLQEWMLLNGRRDPWVAQKLDLGISTIWRYRRDGKAPLIVRIAVEDLTDGQVHRDRGWLNGKVNK